jgi:hypothetical protein
VTIMHCNLFNIALYRCYAGHYSMSGRTMVTLSCTCNATSVEDVSYMTEPKINASC